MTSARSSCGALQQQELTEYWLGELDEAHEQRVDEHLFACAACSERLAALVGLGAAIRRAFLEGWLNLALPEPFLRRIKSAGFQVREYRLAAGGSVSCTVTPDDDFVVAHLRAPLHGVKRLDVLIDDPTSGKHRANDVAFDAQAGALVTMTSTAYLKTLKHSQQRVRLVAVDGVEERVVGDYTFNHYPS
jgi:putative zinc finger protein